MSESRIIYIPDFEDCIVQRKELFNWESEPVGEYFTSFREAKRQMIDSFKFTIDKARSNLKKATSLTLSDFC
jgi:hypothetical protein